MNNLIDLVKDQLGDLVMDKIAGLIGLDNSTASSAISSMLPALLGMVMKKGSTAEGASGLMSLITDNKLGGSVLNNLGDILDGGERSTNFMSMGAGLMSSLFGDDEKDAMSQLSGLAGISQDKTSGLMSLLGPIVMSQIGKVAADKNLDALGLSSMFGSQKRALASLLPAGLSFLGDFFSGTKDAVTGAVDAAGDLASDAASAVVNTAGDAVDAAGDLAGAAADKVGDAASATVDAAGKAADKVGDVAASAGRTAKGTVAAVTEPKKGKGPWMWLIPLLLLLLAGWWFTRGGKDSATTGSKAGDKTEMKNKATSVKSGDTHAGHDHKDGDHKGHSHDGHDHGSKAEVTKAAIETNFILKVDAKGNIVDPYGFIVYKANEVKKDKDGNLVGPTGKILIPVGQIPSLTLKTVGQSSPKLSVNKDGDLVDASGKVLYKKGEFKEVDGYYVDAEGKRIGFFKKIGNAIGDAAEATADAFKGVFTGLFSKKDKTSHRLKRMKFNPENHRLEDYNKNEVMALVEALKANPNTKIDVLVHTDDGKNANQNKQISQKRAEVVHDMMVTLGLTNKQVGFKGMGSGDEKKAKKDVVEILVK